MFSFDSNQGSGVMQPWIRLLLDFLISYRWGHVFKLKADGFGFVALASLWGEVD